MFHMCFMYEQRIPEWLTSSIMILGALQVLSATEANFELFTVFILVIGLLRMVALYINGRWIRTPAIRGIGAIIAVVVFVLLGLSYWIFFILALSDLRAAMIAGKDAIKSRKYVRGYNKNRTRGGY